jgi:hypothetical protein
MMMMMMMMMKINLYNSKQNVENICSYNHKNSGNYKLLKQFFLNSDRSIQACVATGDLENLSTLI